MKIRGCPVRTDGFFVCEGRSRRSILTTFRQNRQQLRRFCDSTKAPYDGIMQTKHLMRQQKSRSMRYYGSGSFGVLYDSAKAPYDGIMQTKHLMRQQKSRLARYYGRSRAARQEQAKILYAVRGYPTGRRSASESAGYFRKVDCENGQTRICSSIGCGHCTAADCASAGGSDVDVCVSPDEPNVSRYAAVQTEQGVYPLRESDCGSAWIVSRFSSRI